MRVSRERTVRRRRGPFRAILARGWTAAALLLCPALAAHAAAQDPDSVQVENRAFLSYRTDDGFTGSATAVATVLRERWAGVLVSPSHEVVMDPGGERVLPHRVDNQGTAADRFRVEAVGPAGWRVALFLDADSDGALGAGDTPLAEPVTLAGGRGAALLLRIEVPADHPGGEQTVEVRATSTTDPAVTGSARDVVTVRRPRPLVTLSKAVDRAEAGRGDTLYYTLAFANRGTLMIPDGRLRDPLPPGLRFVPGSLRLNGSALTEAPDADAGRVEPDSEGRVTVEVQVGDLAPGSSGTVLFAAVVEDATARTVNNVATLYFGGMAEWSRSPPGETVSSRAETRVVPPMLDLTKERVGSDTVRVGAEVRYRIGYFNRSATRAVRDVVVVDTLPAGLVFVSAGGSPEVSGQVVRWTLGTLEPGRSGTLDLVTRAYFVAGSGGTVVNRVVARGTDVGAAAATATALVVEQPGGDELEVRKQAGVLEAGVGETVPYTVVLRNRAGVPLSGMVAHDLLPEGVQLLPESVAGADSVRREGREAHFFVAGPLAPGAEHVLRYSAVLVAPGAEGSLGNRVWATALEGALRSDTVVAWVRLRSGFAMQGRTLIGKVWLDEDGDGRQNSGEKGVPGASVWSADGEVVTTDPEGRFSFRTLRPGTHLLRLDTLGLPGGYTLARPEEGLATVRMDGWTAPRATFRLVRQHGAATRGSPAGGEGSGPEAGVDPPAAGGEGPAPEPRRRVLPPTVPPLRSAEEREAETRRGFLDGPEVRIMSPGDGTVIGTNRLYVGVKGEPGAPVRLYDGDRLIREAVLRPDGVQDFIGLDVEPGPHRIRVWMKNSWQRERWDSVMVHRSGEPHGFEVPVRSLTLRAEGRAPETLRVRVVDRWGVAVADTPGITVEARGAVVDGTDVDRASVGMQLRAALDGSVDVALRGGREVGPGELALSIGGTQVSSRVPLRILPFVRPLIATGVAQVGVGAAPDAFGAVTVQGSLGPETSVSVSYDSRRVESGNEFFQRGFDPLDEARYPTVGDASRRREMAASTRMLAARVERGFDWVEVGDVETPGFGREGSLSAYRRSLTGASGRVSNGPVVVHGFGSVTDQAIEQRQLRGDGSSGPYRIGGGVRPGTERVSIEVRSRENASRVLAREELVRFADYQIDYLSGDVLLQRPVPATDPQGNPVYVVAVLERRSGGEARFVGGVRMEMDAARFFPGRGVDSLGVAVFGVRDAAATQGGAAEYDMVGGDLRVRRGGLEATAELLRAAGADSSAMAARAEVTWSLPGDRARVQAGWLRVGEGFSGSANPRLVSALDELRLVGEMQVAGGKVRLRHERQRFHDYDVERSGTFASTEQTLGGRKLVAEGGLTSDMQASSTGASSSAAQGKVTLALTPRLDLWMEGSQLLRAEGAAQRRPDHVGAGAAYRVLPGARLEGSHRWVRVDRDSAVYALTSVGMRVEALFGGQLWGGVERADVDRSAHSLALGWNQRLSLSGGWSLTSLLERRFGLSHAPLTDPLRALPFAQAERDRWSAGMGVEWLPADSALRFSARGELHDGQERRGHRLDVSGDLPLGPSVALLTRHDWSREEWLGASVGRASRRDRSLLGFALRPTGSDALNALAKVEWRHTASPFLGGSVLEQGRDESRLIGSADVVWAPVGTTELAGRYAVRWVTSHDTLPGVPSVQSLAHYLGGRAGQGVYGALSARVDGRMLLEGATRSLRWSAAPSLVLRVHPQLELEGGYRLGTLRDPDFAAGGGAGAFGTLGFRFTEGVLGGAADFWRQRVASEF